MIQHCTRCLMPSSRPRITFKDGVCNACQFHEKNKSVDWEARALEFYSLYDSVGDTGPYDCVVPFSGGKDSASIAYRLKYAHGLNPLLVCYGQLLWTDVGRYNFHQVANAGFDIIYWRTNQEVSRKLARHFFIERGHPKQHYDAAVNSVPLITAVKFGIPLVFYAEHGESEYGGHILSEEHRKQRFFDEVLENQVGDDPRNWTVDGITEKDLYPYIMPEPVFMGQEYPEIKIGPVKAYYYSYFFPWDIYENAKLAREKMGFRQARNGLEIESELLINVDGSTEHREWPPWVGKSDGSFEGYDSIDDKIDDLDFYMMQIKFGFGRATRMASRLIQKGHMTREQGLELVKRYDGEYPETYMKDVCEYLSMTEVELGEIVDKHRNPEIWERRDDQWELKCPPK